MKPPEPLTITNDPEPLNLHISNVYSFVPGGLCEGVKRADVLRGIEACLPSFQRASSHIEAYLAHTEWFSCLIRREQVEEEIIPTVYERAVLKTGGDYTDIAYVHRLALFLAVLACGAALNSSLPTNNAEAARYNDLAQMCLNLRSVFQETSLENVQTIVLLSHYYLYSGQTLTFDSAWKTLRFALTLGLSVSKDINVRSKGMMAYGTFCPDWTTYDHDMKVSNFVLSGSPRS